MQLPLAYLLCCICTTASTREIIITEKGSDTLSCLEEPNLLVSCECQLQSLVDVSKHVTSHKLNNITIRINETNYTLQGVANFSGVDNITITGKSNTLTEINCDSANTSEEAGIVFHRSSDITLKNFTISNCGATIDTNRGHLTGNGTAIQIIGCCQVNVLGIVVKESISQGLTFINTGSTVQVIDSHFINNTVNVTQSQWLGGGALQVIFYGTEILNSTYYTIANSTFQFNKAIIHKVNEHKIFNSKNCERGGGIRIISFDNVLHNSSITLDNNRMEGNSAVFGGGALIYVSGNTSHNRISILNSHFINNKVLAGGGGIDTGYTTSKNFNNKISYPTNNEISYPTNNTISISNSSFIGNAASFGGGLSTFTASISYNAPHARNHFYCDNCQFKRNTARGGAAVNIGRDIFRNDGSQYIMIPLFENSIIENNTVVFVADDNTQSGASDGNGAFFVSEVDVTFEGTTNFTKNNGTALYLDSTTAIFKDGTVYFIDNSGYQGGAILLFGKSDIYIDDYISFYFHNNTATKFGGAICALTGGKHVFSYMNSCFLKVSRQNRMHMTLPTNLNFHFLENTATIGHDIYATSIASCNMLCSNQLHTAINDTSPFFDFGCYGNFTFSNSNITECVATSPIKITIDFQSAVMPGIAAPLKIVQHDEVGGNVSQLFPLTAKVQSSLYNAKVDSAYTVITNNSIILLGSPGDEGELLFESSTIRHVISFKLSYCGPGFVFDEERACACFRRYFKIHCEPNKLAAIASNYWAGYNNDSNATQYNLYTGVCVTQLCNPHPKIYGNGDDLHYKLPPTADAQKLEKRICGENRQGRLCGRCIQNKSVYYHSENFICGNNTSCQYGIPIYIASELLPVTIIFLIILLFNISLTSGAVYSFVFYVQILSRLNVTALGTIHIKHDFTRGVVNFFRLVLGVFTFDIRSGSHLEFCIFQTDSIMNLFMIKYATLAYAFFLVIATILIMRIHSCYSCVKVCRRCGRRNIRGSIVDGLSAFLVLCYFQCAVVTSCILTPARLYGINETWYTTVPMFDGELDYLKGAHLWYALPAFLCMIIILIPPPTILILEPILTKLFSMDCFTSTPPKWYYNRLRLKLMPFLDSFQACFRDRHRYFAGLYFLYRLYFPIIGIFSADPQYHYGIAVCLFMLITLFHVLLQPYKRKWHDLLEISLFINITTLLTITLYNYSYHKPNGTDLINAQLVLISLSIGYIVVYIAIKIYQNLVALKMKKEIRPVSRECTEVNENTTDSLPYRLLNDNNEVTISNSYRTF